MADRPAAPFLAAWMNEAGQRGDLYAPDCPAREVLEHLTSRWGVLVLIALLSGPYRFSELGRTLTGVSDKMLASTLNDLQRNGIVRRTSRDGEQAVAYSLTEAGVEAARLIATLTDWINDNLGELRATR